MAGEKAREYALNLVHQISRRITSDDIGSVVEIGDVPACAITRIVSVKAVDFNGTTTSQLDVGVDYSDDTAADPDALVVNADLSSSVALGPTDLSFADNANAVVSVPATITASPTVSGGGGTAGETYLVVEYVPLTHIGNS